MHRSTARIAYIVLLLALAIALSGCMDASVVQSGSGPVSVSIQDAPASLGDLDLSVSGPGMSDIDLTVSRETNAIVLDVPVGADRAFDLIGFLNGDTTAFYHAQETVGIGPNGLQVSLPMRLRSKIVVPDDDLGVISQIDAVPPSGSPTVFTNLGSINAFSPRDIDFDAQGRMYVAASIVARADSIAGGNLEALPTTDGFFNSIAIDRDAGILYMASNFEISKANLDGGSEVASWIDWDDLIPTAYNIQGLAVDRDGYLYAAQAPGVSKIDPSSGSVVAQYFIPNYSDFSDGVSDVMVKDNSVYLLRFDSPEPNSTILRLSRDLSTVMGSYGQTTSPGEADEPGEFVAPLRFVATLNRKITIAESDNSGFARIVSIDDLDGNGWSTFGNYGSDASNGEYQLYFYSYGGT